MDQLIDLEVFGISAVCEYTDRISRDAFPVSRVTASFVTAVDDHAFGGSGDVVLEVAGLLVDWFSNGG